MLYKDLVENIVDGKISHKFNIFKYYDFNDIHLDYIPGGVDATYIFGGNHEASYNDSPAIINIILKHNTTRNYKECAKELNDYFSINGDHLLIYSIDKINEAFIGLQDELNSIYIYELALYIINNINKVEAIKLAIFFLSFINIGENDKKIIYNLALCDEFTFFVLFYHINQLDNKNDIIFDLIKKTNGFGKIFLMDKLKITDNKIREYIITKGVYNTSDIALMSNIIYNKLDISKFINDDMSEELYKSISIIIDSLIENDKILRDKFISNINLYLDYFYKFEDKPFTYLCISNLYFYNDEGIHNRLDKIVNNRKFIKKISAKLEESKDFDELYQIIYLIDSYKLDFDKEIFNKFNTNPFKYTFMYEKLIKTKYKDKATNLLADSFPGKRDELTDNYSLFDDYAFKLKFVLKLINDYPYINNKFIILGLKNKFVDVRNMALDTLFNWNRESDIDFKDTDIYKELVKLKDKEVTKELKDSINELLS